MFVSLQFKLEPKRLF